MKKYIRRAIARFASPKKAGGVRVLLYHSIDEPDPDDAMALRVPPHMFRKQMTLLRDEGFVVVPLSSVHEPHEDDGCRRVAITFDDGYLSDKWAAAVLREFGFDATFFLVPRFLDGLASPAGYWERWNRLRWEDAEAIAEHGFDIGAHSATHVDLRTCAGARLDEEVAGARALLEAKLNRAVPHFSFPFGRFDRRVAAAVERAGFRLACTSRYGVNRTAGPCFTVRRTEVTGRDDLRTFRKKLRGQYDWLGLWQDLKSS